MDLNPIFSQERIIVDNLNLPTFSPLLSESGYYDVSPENEKLLLLVKRNQPDFMKIVVVPNWF